MKPQGKKTYTCVPLKRTLGTNRPRKQVTPTKEATSRTPCSPFLLSHLPLQVHVAITTTIKKHLGTKTCTHHPHRRKRSDRKKKKQDDQNAGACQIPPQQHQQHQRQSRSSITAITHQPATTGTSARPKLSLPRTLLLSLFPPPLKKLEETGNVRCEREPAHRRFGGSDKVTHRRSWAKV